MAVYTEVTTEALDSFLKSYDVGKVLSFKGIAGGVENTNYLLHTDQASYILTLYEKRVAKEYLPFFLGLMNHLSDNGFACPAPVADREGKMLAELEGRPAALISFLEGMEVSKPSIKQTRMAGATMAKLHEAAYDFEIKRKNALDPSGWPALVRENVDQADSVEAGLADLITNELAFIQSRWPESIPSGVIHADMFKDNVFFLNDELSGVIDFYFACNDFLAYDLAVAINAWCFNDDLSFNRATCEAMMEGYQSVRHLTDDEKKALPTLARGAALRFLLTRLNDWLNVPPGALVVPHDPKAFSARLRFFQNADASIFGAS